MARYVKAKFVSNAVILQYHRVSESDIDPFGLCTKPWHFEEHLQALKDHACPIGIDELSRACHEGHIPDRAVVVTFDDGYLDNLINAKPLLVRFHIPATVFIATGYIGQSRGFWWDELAELLLQSGTLPNKLCLQLQDDACQWDLGPAVSYSEADRRGDYDCRVWTMKPGSRFAFYYSVWQRLRPLSGALRKVALDQIRSWSSSKPTHNSTHRPLSAEELQSLAQGGMTDVGAHTVSHAMLPACSIENQRHEILESKISLERLLARPVTSFAYPYGEYTGETATLVREAGFACACSTVPESFQRDILRNSRYLTLPRIAAEDCNGKQFVNYLDRWFKS
jgi:peptidoglycan/xylan/chitin deacetylase (PgdA/CDA1 family)